MYMPNSFIFIHFALISDQKIWLYQKFVVLLHSVRWRSGLTRLPEKRVILRGSGVRIPFYMGQTSSAPFFIKKQDISVLLFLFFHVNSF